MLLHSDKQNWPHLGRGPHRCTGRKDGQKSGHNLGGDCEYTTAWGSGELGLRQDSQSAVDPQFEDAHIEEEEYEEEVVIESVTEEELEEPVAGKPPTQEN